MAIRDKLYSYSEAQAAFPFTYDSDEGVLYLNRGKKGAAFVIPITYRTIVSGDLYLLEQDKKIILNTNQGILIDIETGVVNITGKPIGGKTENTPIMQLKNIYNEKELQIVNLRKESLEITISPRVPASVYILKFEL